VETEGLLPLPTDAPTLPAGTVIGRCKILRLIATGGQGSIYFARHESLERDVAVKVLPPSLSGDEEFVRRFLREARSAAKLEHPNIVQVYDAATENNLHFIVMQFVDGKDLQTILDKKPRAPVGDALSITKRVALALAAAHKTGVMHRDIKPSNIMITKQGKVMVTDFGLARDISATMSATITQGGFVMGTPDFLSPEQAMGERTDARSDIYSLGATLYRMLAGQPPYPDGNPMTVMMKHVRENEQPTPLRSLNRDVSPAAEALVNKMMAKTPSQRYQTMDEVAQAIDMVKGSRGTTLLDAEAVTAAPHKMWTNIAVGVGIGIAIVILLVLMLRPSAAERAWRAAQQAEHRAEQDPLLLPEAIRAYRMITEQYAASPQSKLAGERLILLDQKFTRHKHEERLREIEGAYPIRTFTVCSEELRELVSRKPGTDIEKRAQDVRRRLSRQEILTRAAGAVKLVQENRFDDVVQLIDPDDVGQRTAQTLRLLFRKLIAPAGAPAKLDVQLHGDGMTIDVAAGRAVLPVTSTVRHDNGSTTQHPGEWRWKMTRDAWFLDLKE